MSPPVVSVEAHPPFSHGGGGGSWELWGLEVLCPCHKVQDALSEGSPPFSVVTAAVCSPSLSLSAGSACTEHPLGSLPFFFAGTVSSLLLLGVFLPFSLFNFSGQRQEGTQPSGPLLCPPAVKPTAVTAHGTTEFKKRGRDTASASCCVCGCHVCSRRHTRGTISPSAVTCLSLWSP